MARDIHIKRPGNPMRLAPPAPTHEERVAQVARHVLEDVARRILTRKAQYNRY